MNCSILSKEIADIVKNTNECAKLWKEHGNKESYQDDESEADNIDEELNSKSKSSESERKNEQNNRKKVIIIFRNDPLKW